MEELVDLDLIIISKGRDYRLICSDQWRRRIGKILQDYVVDFGEFRWEFREKN